MIETAKQKILFENCKCFSDNLRIIAIGAFGPYSKHRFTTLPLVLKYFHSVADILPLVLLYFYLVANFGFAKLVGLMETLILK